MKAISLWQPWASLIALGKKRIETRSWYTDYRGPIAIHAAKRRIDDDTFYFLMRTDAFARATASMENRFERGSCPYGCIVATAYLANCVRIEKDVMNYNYYSSYVPMYSKDKSRLIGWQHLYNEMIRIPPAPTEDEFYFGDYTPGRYAWMLSNIRALAITRPAKGMQRIWEWQDA